MSRRVLTPDDREKYDHGPRIEFITPKQSAKVYTSRNWSGETKNTITVLRDEPAHGDQPTADDDVDIPLIRTKEYSAVSKLSDHDHLTDTNWHEWKESMQRVFINCDITDYITGDLMRPSENALNWDKNDTWAQQVIIQNITSSQMNHVGSKETAHEMYCALLATHKNFAHQTVTYILTQLYETKVPEGGDFLKHLDMLKNLRDHINRFPNTEFHISDTCFKAIVSASLPASRAHNLLGNRWGMTARAETQLGV